MIWGKHVGERAGGAPARLHTRLRLLTACRDAALGYARAVSRHTAVSESTTARRGRGAFSVPASTFLAATVMGLLALAYATSALLTRRRTNP